jgi:hypothetical protein
VKPEFTAYDRTVDDSIEPDPRDHEDEGLGSGGQVAGLGLGSKIWLVTIVVLFGALAVLSTVLKGP